MQLQLAEYKRLFNRSDAAVQLQRDFAAASTAYKSTIGDLQRQLAKEKASNAQLAEGKLQMTQSLASIDSTYKSVCGSQLMMILKQILFMDYLARNTDFLVEQAESSKRVVATESNLNAAKSHISEMQRHRDELDRKLAKSKAALAERIARETQALEKIQEVLALAEAATAERDAAIERERDTKGLC